jgi:hypothetical protein
MQKFNVAIVDWNNMFRPLIIKYHPDVYNILKKGDNSPLYITAVYSCYVQVVHWQVMYSYFVFWKTKLIQRNKKKKFDTEQRKIRAEFPLVKK